MKNINFNNGYNKNIFLWKNPKKLLNKYFFHVEKKCEINMFFKIINGLPKLFWYLLYKRSILFEFHRDLPKSKKLKQRLINFYSLIFFSLGLHEYSQGIFIIGDQLNPMNKGLLQAVERLTNIEVWIINQGSGSMVEKLNVIYSNNIKRIYFPFAKESDFENKLIEKANLRNNIKFLNIDTSLNIKISSLNNKLAIFTGYDKNKRLYPLYILYIIKELIKLIYSKSFKNFENVDIFLHPRLGYFLIFNYIKFNKKISLKILDDNSSYIYSYIISYSPTIDSSLMNSTKKSSKYIKEYGKNFNSINVQNHIKNFKEIF